MVLLVVPVVKVVFFTYNIIGGLVYFEFGYFGVLIFGHELAIDTVCHLLVLLLFFFVLFFSYSV